MSPLGRLFILVLFGSSLYWVGRGILYAIAETRVALHQKGLSRLVKGFAGGIIWLVFFLIWNEFGWRAGLGLLIVVCVPFSLFLLTLSFVYRPAAERIISFFDFGNYEDWAISFFK
jgi:hypothetical protein